MQRPQTLHGAKTMHSIIYLTSSIPKKSANFSGTPFHFSRSAGKARLRARRHRPAFRIVSARGHNTFPKSLRTFRGPRFISLARRAEPACASAGTGRRFASYPLGGYDTFPKSLRTFRGPRFISLARRAKHACAPAGTGRRFVSYPPADTILSQKVCGLFGGPVSFFELLYHTRRQMQSPCLRIIRLPKQKGEVPYLSLSGARGATHTFSPSVG